MRWFYNILLLLCLLVGIAGRFWGSYINREANDNHAYVVERILADQKIDHRDSCWECFQPPIFYQANAGLAKLRKKTGRVSILKQMQVENVIFSLLAVFFLFLLLKHEKIPDRWRYLITGFWLVNPALFGIGIQSTNDTLIILLGAMTTYFLIRYIQQKKLPYLLGAIASFVLAPYFKGSGLAVLLLGAILAVLCVLIMKRHRWALGLVGLAFYLLTFHSHYTKNYRKYGDAFAINQLKTSPPPLFDDGQEFWKRPGITSIWSSYFKFQFPSLIKTPYNVNSGPDYPIHRTSFWAQNYGSFYHAQFLYHPWSWTTKHNDLQNLARTTFVFGLIPLLIFILGILKELQRFFTQFKFDKETLIRFVHFGFLMGFLVFNLKYTYDYRDFGCIKSIFMLPAMLSITYFVIQGLRLKIWNTFRRPLHFILGLIILLCSLNSLFLLAHLSKPYFNIL